MSVLPQFRAGEPTPARYGVCVLLGLIGIFVAGAMFQSGASTPVGLFAFGASLIGGAGWFGLAWLEATELDELEGGR
jgi:hypothetical protein